MFFLNVDLCNSKPRAY